MRRQMIQGKPAACRPVSSPAQQPATQPAQSARPFARPPRPGQSRRRHRETAARRGAGAVSSARVQRRCGPRSAPECTAGASAAPAAPRPSAAANSAPSCRRNRPGGVSGSGTPALSSGGCPSGRARRRPAASASGRGDQRRRDPFVGRMRRRSAIARPRPGGWRLDQRQACGGAAGRPAPGHRSATGRSPGRAAAPARSGGCAPGSGRAGPGAHIAAGAMVQPSSRRRKAELRMILGRSSHRPSRPRPALAGRSRSPAGSRPLRQPRHRLHQQRRRPRDPVEPATITGWSGGAFGQFRRRQPRPRCAAAPRVGGASCGRNSGARSPGRRAPAPSVPNGLSHPARRSASGATPSPCISSISAARLSARSNSAARGARSGSRSSSPATSRASSSRRRRGAPAAGRPARRPFKRRCR
jgi:hypothetical protein